MALKPLDTKTSRLATLKPFDIPIDGETYSIRPVDADIGLFLQELFATLASAQAAEDAGIDSTISEEHAERLRSMMAELNDDATLDRMIGAENLKRLRSTQSTPVVELVIWTVIYWTVSGREAGEEFWNTGGHPKAPNRAQRRAQGKKKAKPKA